MFVVVGISTNEKWLMYGVVQEEGTTSTSL
jgi:hypothetical protein